MELYSITPTTVIQNSFVHAGNNRTDKSSPPTDGQKNSLEPEDTVTLSREAKDKSLHFGFSPKTQSSSSNQNTDNLDQEELKQLQQMKTRDTEVRTHEQAHLSAAGQYARGGATFTYQKGPDGSSYAVGGEVGIDIAEDNTPEATIAKMRVIKRAALAPATPSAADKQIAAQANTKEALARQELLQSEQESLLKGESLNNGLSKNQSVNQIADSEIISSNYGSLKSKLAAYQKMASS